MTVEGPLLPLLALALPLLLGALVALPPLRQRALLVLPLAPLPALVLALQVALEAPPAAPTRVPGLLLGVELGVDARSALFVGMAAALWSLAGVYASRYLRGTRRGGVFAGFWCLTLAGNLGVFIARDAATFYAAFAAVSLAAYLLVVHDGTARARRAGRLYLALAVVGEAALLAGLMLGVHAAGSLDVEAIRAALVTSRWRDAASALLILGFGLKAGLMPLHVWLPLAHPAAPTPASAVLSGAIVKAGLFGLMAFLPAGAGGFAWGQALTLAGIAGAYVAVLIGLTQANAKAVLAYSTVSQMGLLIAVLGAGLARADAQPALDAVALGAVHHGLAKGALFLAVGVVAAGAARHRAWVLAATALVALSVAGLPATGGALAKAALKGAAGGAALEFAITLSAAGTALLLGRLLWLLQRSAPACDACAPPPALVAPWLVLLAAAVGLPWLLASPADALSAAALASGLWPLMLAAAVAAAARRLWRRVPAVPEGDLALPLERWAHAAVAAVAGAARAAAARGADGRAAAPPPTPPAGALERLEHALSRWSVAGALVLLLALAAAAVT